MVVNQSLPLLYEQDFYTFLDKIYSHSTISCLQLVFKKLLFFLFHVATGKEAESYTKLCLQLPSESKALAKAY
jgi:hypothetical protein